MKVFVKFNYKVYLLENVGVDNKCLPLVAGKPPYDEKFLDTSPLVLESVLWFKTMALEAIYIDCHKRLVYWAPHAVTQGDHILPVEINADNIDFAPSTAKPLFTDCTVYDFDASPKEMIMKCCEVFSKLCRKSISTDDFHKSMARILHLYILPAIVFTGDDLCCLSQAKAQIEKQLNKAEDDIKNCATVAENLKKCLNRMASQLLDKENMDSENYLRNCKQDFLEAFLKVITLDVENLNIELSAAQNNVNWARDHSKEPQQLVELKERRDQLFLALDKYIMAREAIKNVIVRRELTKRKVKKGVIIKSCVHNVFVEVLRKLESQNVILRQLGKDKVNICAAREAVLSTIAGITNSNHNSDHATRFELDNFVDCFFVNGKGINKPEDWLTLEERVAKLLKDKLSVSHMYHVRGCKKLSSEIDHILNVPPVSVYSRRADSFIHLQKSLHVNPSFHLSLNDATMREQRQNEREPHKWNAITLKPNVENIQALEIDAVKHTAGTHGNNHGLDLRGLCRSRSALVLAGGQYEVCNGEFNKNWFIHQRKTPATSEDFVENMAVTYELLQSGNSGICKEDESLEQGQHFVLRQQLRESSLLDSIDSFKDEMQVHFTEVIECLDQELEREENWMLSFQEEQELLWKSYEHFFCQELYLPLMKLYTEGFTPSIQQAYATVCGIPLQEILKGDKLLDLFYGQDIISRTPISFASSGHLNDQCLTYQGLVTQPSYVNKLYFPINADGNHHHKSCLDSSKTGEFSAKTPNCDFLLSTTPSIDEGFDASSCSFSSSVQSDFSVGSLDEDIMDNAGRWRKLSSIEKDEPVLTPVLSSIRNQTIFSPLRLHTILSPFRMHVTKCVDSKCFLDKVHCITKAVEVLNTNISKMIGSDYQSACDDIISMLLLALCHISEDMFVDLYINLRLLMDVLPSFFSGSLWDYNLTSLCASYNYLFTLKVCEHEVKQYKDL